MSFCLQKYMIEFSRFIQGEKKTVASHLKASSLLVIHKYGQIQTLNFRWTELAHDIERPPNYLYIFQCLRLMWSKAGVHQGSKILLKVINHKMLFFVLLPCVLSNLACSLEHFLLTTKTVLASFLEFCGQTSMLLHACLKRPSADSMYCIDSWSQSAVFV